MSLYQSENQSSPTTPDNGVALYPEIPAETMANLRALEDRRAELDQQVIDHLEAINRIQQKIRAIDGLINLFVD